MEDTVPTRSFDRRAVQTKGLERKSSKPIVHTDWETVILAALIRQTPCQSTVARTVAELIREKRLRKTARCHSRYRALTIPFLPT